ncbi:MAG: hypothetical protein JWQ43_2571 [Glaciihabitans sp.]|nr:hypothetical protein [Glaciihabitans sp.]
MTSIDPAREPEASRTAEPAATSTAGSTTTPAATAGSTTDTYSDGAVKRPIRRLGWASTAVAIIFGLVYAYYLYDAINSLVQVPAEYEALGLSTADAPWGLLVMVLLIPIVTYAGAFVVGRRRNVFGRAVIFAAGLGVLATLTASAISLA